GFYLSAHPLDAFAQTLEKLGVQAYADVMRRLNRSTQSHLVAGTVISKQLRRSAKGNRFAFIQCSDPTGMFEVTVFSELLSAHFDLLEPGRSVLFRVEGRIDDRDQPRLMVQSVDDLDMAASRAEARGMTCLQVFVSDPRAVTGLDGVLSQTARGKGRIVLTLNLAEQGQEADIALPGGYALSPRVRGALKSVRGVLDVRDVMPSL
ncbi:MAG: OB-fold nucleic acid binding domain-containing protein, partial [Sneathiellaceae bacterium]